MFKGFNLKRCTIGELRYELEKRNKVFESIVHMNVYGWKCVLKSLNFEQDSAGTYLTVVVEEPILERSCLGLRIIMHFPL